MASYHLAVQIIGRKTGRSTVAAAAYRAGQRLRDERAGEVHDFSRRRGVAHAEVMIPEGAAPWLADRERLWNHVEGLEKRKDAQLAREINLALPHELTGAERLDLVRTFVREQFVARGMVADVALHEPVPEKGDDPRNFHAHIMLTLRQAEAHGLRRVKTREWNSDSELVAWRAAWAAAQNRALERHGHRVRVDHRSLGVQRAAAQAAGDRVAAEALDRLPEIHVGPRARAAGRHERVPSSRPKVEATARPRGGAWRSSAKPEKRERLRDYPRIDRGSRPEWNAARAERNHRASMARVDKFERQMVRLRQRELRALAQLSRPMSSGFGLGILRRVQRQAEAHRRELARKHAKRSRDLQREIERILARLFHVRHLSMERHQALVRSALRQLRPREGRSRSER